MTRVLMIAPGAEFEVHRYRITVPDTQLDRKLAELASKFFRSWEHGTPGLPAIHDLNSECVLLAVKGSGEEVFL